MKQSYLGGSSCCSKISTIWSLPHMHRPWMLVQSQL
eukprot:XP_001707299.1 Hypothetical protein GL50803_37336 [Giardia lamblia ATCC 50803]